MKNFLLKMRFFCLFPLAWAYEKVMEIRRNLYNGDLFTRNVFRVPIISVGNITFGGTGKTPFTLWLAQFFTKENLHPLILTRGYKGKLEHGHGMIRAEDRFRFDPVEYGDEALLLARRLKKGTIIVGKKRSENLKFYFEKILPDVVLLDDGFQHLKLYRNFNIVLFDALLPLNRYWPAPLGYLREGKGALKDADAVIISRCNLVSPEELAQLKSYLTPSLKKDVLWAEISYQPTGLFNEYFEMIHPSTYLEGKKVLAVSGLASPNSFFTELKNLRANLVGQIAYPDHFYFRKQDVEEWVQKAKKEEAIIVVSEKDMVKIRTLSMNMGILFLGIEVKFEKGEEILRESILKICQKFREHPQRAQ